MTIRRTVILVLALSSVSCTELFNQKSRTTGVSSARPREPMVAARRRTGSDVTTPARPDKGWVIDALLPCDASDSSAVKPRFDPVCTGIDAQGDIVEQKGDTGVAKRP
jgi:hypothetical protein